MDELAADPTIEFVFVGREFAMEGDHHISAEYALMKERGVSFLPIIAGRLQRTYTAQTIPALLKVPIGCVQAMLYCLRERPSLIVSFGGYVSLPVALAGWLLHIPVITHEQTLAPGLANKLIERMSTRVCVTFAETLHRFAKDKAVLTGLPMRSELFTSTREAPYSADEKKYPIVYITGGSTGAHSLNMLLFPIIAELVKKYTVIHQTGAYSMQTATTVHHGLPVSDRKRYVPCEFIPLHTLSWILKHAKFVIGRSGANTTMELAALGKVAILVPLPWSAGNEQLLQARWLSTHGGAVVVEQDAVRRNTLMHHILEIGTSYEALRRRAETFAKTIPRDGTARLAKEILRNLPASI